MSTIKYIELIGLPGSGKTEAAKLLLKCLQERTIDGTIRAPINAGIFTKIGIIFGVGSLFLQSPWLLRIWFFSIKGDYSHTPHIKAVVKNVRRRLVVEAVIIRYLMKQERGVLINDEGLIGKMVVLSLLIGIKEDDVVVLLSSLLPSSVFLIHINTPTELAIARASQRSIDLPFFDEMDPTLKFKFYKHNSEVYSRVCERLQASHGAKIARLKNAGARSALKVELESVVQVIV